MAFRFQRRIRIAPGVRINLSKSGLGLSVGPRGYSASIGPRGMYQSVGIPGTGLSHRSRIGGSGRGSPATVSGGASETVAVEIGADGPVRFRLPDGSEAPAALVRRIRQQNGAAIEAMIEAAVEKLNRDLTACLSIHLETPAPDYQPIAILTPPPPCPEPPEMAEIGFWDRMLGRRGSIEAANAALEASHRRKLHRWTQEMEERARLELELNELNDAVRVGDPEAQTRLIESRLSEIAWAKPTDVAFDFGDDASTLDLDIDLPTIEELPEREALVPSRGLNLRWKARSAAQRRRDFCYVAHAALFRVVGEAFATLPRLAQVTASGFTQRDDPATGRKVDTYIISVRVSRADWSHIEFSNLAAVDVVQALERFDLVRDLTRSGDLREIEPLAQEVPVTRATLAPPPLSAEVIPLRASRTH